MLTATDYRCTGDNCPSKKNCHRYRQRDKRDLFEYAAFWARREAGSDACEQIIPVRVVSTFNDASNRTPR